MIENILVFADRKVRLNAFIRLTCHCLGIYDIAKRVFMLVYTRKNERRK